MDNTTLLHNLTSQRSLTTYDLQIQAAKMDQGGLKPELKEAVKSLQNYYKGLIDNGLFSGGILVAVGKQPIFSEFHSITPNQHFNEHTLFNSCSVSKVLTALAIHQLVSSGSMRLDQTLNDLHLNEVEGLDLKQLGQVTVSELLNHTSGIVDRHPMQYNYHPEMKGEFSYSNYAYQILAEIITQKSPHQSFQLHIKNMMKEAGMDDALTMMTQFTAPVSSFAKPDHFQAYSALQTQEKERVQKEIHNIEKQMSTQNVPQDMLKEHQITLNKLKEKLEKLQLPEHLEPLASGDVKSHSYVTPPAGNGCWDISVSDWLNFSTSLTKEQLNDLTSSPINHPHSDPVDNVKYCAGFEKRNAGDNGTVLYRSGDSAGSSAMLLILNPDDPQPISIVVSSNLGESRGGMIGDQICDIMNGKKIDKPLQRIMDARHYYERIISCGDDTEKLNKVLLELSMAHHVDPMSIAIALKANGKDTLLSEFFGPHSPLTKDAQQKLLERLNY